MGAQLADRSPTNAPGWESDPGAVSEKAFHLLSDPPSPLGGDVNKRLA